MAKRIDPVKRILTQAKKLNDEQFVELCLTLLKMPSDEQAFELWKAIAEDPENPLYRACAAQISVALTSSLRLSLEHKRQMAKRNRQKDKQRLIDGQLFSEMKHKQKRTWPDILKFVLKDKGLRKRYFEDLGEPPRPVPSNSEEREKYIDRLRKVAKEYEDSVAKRPKPFEPDELIRELPHRLPWVQKISRKN